MVSGLLKLQHLIIALSSIVASSVLAYEGVITGPEVLPLLSAALVYGIGAQAISNGKLNGGGSGH